MSSVCCWNEEMYLLYKKSGKIYFEFLLIKKYYSCEFGLKKFYTSNVYMCFSESSFRD